MIARGGAAKKDAPSARDDARKKSVQHVSERPSDQNNNAVVGNASGIVKFRDPARYSSPIAKKYIALADKMADVRDGDPFNMFIIGVIIVAGAMVGMQTYKSLDGDPTIESLDLVILAIFAAECIIKIVAESFAPWRYFTGSEWRWNCFDFTIVVLCLPVWGNTFGGGSVALLRLMRLMRVMKLVKKIPQLQMIVMGILGGLGSIGYIMLLLFLVFYLYAIAGIYAFRENDPWHFKDLPTALLSLFRAATMEDWTDIMYVNIYGCEAYKAVYVAEEDREPNNVDYWCNMPKANMVISPIYYVTFVVISGLVMLSLFVGAVTMSMSDSMEAMQNENEEAQRRKQMEQQMKKLHYAEHLEKKADDELYSRREAPPPKEDETPRGSFFATVKRRSMSSFSKKKEKQGSVSPSSENKMTEKEKEEERDRKEMTKLLLGAWEGVDLVAAEDDNGDDDMGYTGLKLAYWRLSCKVKRVVENPRFVNFITFVIIVAGVQVGAQTDKTVEKEAGESLKVLDGVILAIFTAEVVLKFIAEAYKPWRVFRSGWNTFDFIIVVGSFVLGGGAITMLRLLRLLRVLKLVKSLPELQVIVSALMMGLASIGYIGVILFLVFYVFAILGMILFDANDPWHFGTLHRAMLTLFRCSTFEDWTDVMYINMYGCDQYGYDAFPEKCTDPYGNYYVGMIYFLIFEVIGALVLLTLFVGVVTTSMDEATEQQAKEKDVERRLQELVKKQGLSEQEVNAYRKTFQMLDLDGSGTIEEDELRIGLLSVGKTPSDNELQYMLSQVDEDNSGEIDMAEFTQFMLNLKKQTKRNENMAVEDANGGDEFGGGVPLSPASAQFLDYLTTKQTDALVKEKNKEPATTTKFLPTKEGPQMESTDDKHAAEIRLMKKENTFAFFEGAVRQAGTDWVARAQEGKIIQEEKGLLNGGKEKPQEASTPGGSKYRVHPAG